MTPAGTPAWLARSHWCRRSSQRPAAGPALAAGGIGAGSQIAAALAMGAQGAWLGTVWLGSTEHWLPAALTDKLVAAASEDTVITRAHSGKPCRVVRSAFSGCVGGRRCATAARHALSAGPDRPAAGRCRTARDRAAHARGGGQSVAWVREVEPVARIMDRLVRETRHSLDGLRPYLQG
ncbi:nitronate monooxygenase [Cupriavidus basilensis]